jgi:hypothetical protein
MFIGVCRAQGMSAEFVPAFSPRGEENGLVAVICRWGSEG